MEIRKISNKRLSQTFLSFVDKEYLITRKFYALLNNPTFIHSLSKFLFNLMDESCTAHYSVPYITFYHLVICAPVPVKTASQWEDRRSLICVFIQSLTIFKRFEVSEVVGASILMQINRKHWRNYTWIHRSIWYFNDFLGLRINFMKKSMALGGNKK